MLKGISPVISPELLKALAEMGHGDELVIADGNFPCHSVGKNSIVIRADGHGVPEVLDAILNLIPLDTYTDKPVALMEVVKGDTCGTPEIWSTYEEILNKYEPDHHDIDYTERFAFYEEAKKAYAVIATSETSQYANVILQKGCVLL